MAWEHLSINRPHLVYIILGGFTSIFMLCSLFIKEKLYIGEATVATICGIIFGPSAANLINPLGWGNTDQITLEFSRIVLVVQCFAVGVELPKFYMERHWKSMVMLLVPVMTWGWLVTSLFIWWMIEPLTWLESLICAACVTATDPVLASSVVGKGKFARRIPRHLRDILSAESGCNDGMSFPFIYLALYLARFRPDANQVTFRWICYIILYECLFGAIYGFCVGYIARHAIKLAERKSLIDRESFLVFYFVLALFCAGSGSMLGMDDLLIGFSAGVGFSNDGWFTEKTEESHVSNVIDLLLNLTYFVYFGTVIPWGDFNNPDQGMIPWKLVVLGLFVLLFRRIPIMLALKPLIPDVGTWREALFAGHFGPIGVGAIFVAILARAELQTESTDPIAEPPDPGSENFNVIFLIWPITCFLVILSIAIHGSSIAVFTLGKRINTLTLTVSYTQDNETGRSWMDRLPRISASNTKSVSKEETASVVLTENPPFEPGTLGPTSFPGNFLRRQREETEKLGGILIGRSKRKRNWEPGKGPGGPISQSAIAPQRNSELPSHPSPEDDATTVGDQLVGRSSKSGQIIDVEKTSPSSSTSTERGDHDRTRVNMDVEAYEEGGKMIIEDEEGNILSITETAGLPSEEKAQRIGQERRALSQGGGGEHVKDKHKSHDEGETLEPERAAGEAAGNPLKNLRRQLGGWRGWGKSQGGEVAGDSRSWAREKPQERKRGPAHAYQFGNNIIVEDEDGEVIRSYNLSGHDEVGRTSEESSGQGWRKMSGTADMRRGLSRMGTWVGMGGEKQNMSADTSASIPSVPTEMRHNTASNRTRRRSSSRPEGQSDLFDDDALRFTISHIDRYGHGLSGTSGTSHAHGINTQSERKYSAADFLKELQQMDPKAQNKAIDNSGVPEHVKTEMRRVTREDSDGAKMGSDRLDGAAPGQVVLPGGRPQPAPHSASDSDLPNLLSSALSRPGIQKMETERSRPAASLADDSSTAKRSPAIAMSTEDEGQDSIPTHDVTSTLAKYRRDGSTAAERRRQRLATIRSGGSSEDLATTLGPVSAPAERQPNERDADDGSGDEVETGPERRRRLGALGISQEREGSESEEDDGGRGPRSREIEVSRSEPAREPDPEPESRPRVQWGQVLWKEAAKSKDGADDGDGDEDGEGGSDGAAKGGGARKAIRGLLSPKKT